ncbi:Alkylglycerol monooxygenase [Chionoecetes opilio]|uniref:Alkylglycerol monooxygenase n=1 Tax=Chionoecetes opilio TaxID=41210 RepID=A0A8J8WF75_CHIOP|nr:Alkylglycerol monooxygenase [Chionoecetes opilio]
MPSDRLPALKKLRSKSPSRASAIQTADGRLVSDMEGQMARWAEFIFRGVEFSVYVWVYKSCRLVSPSWNSPTTYVLGLLGVDLCSYWWHRASHEVSLMWAAHYVHHSSEDFNLSTAGRISITMRPVDLLFPPLALLVFLPFAYLMHSQLSFCVGLLEPQRDLPQDPQAAAGPGSHHRVCCGDAHGARRSGAAAQRRSGAAAQRRGAQLQGPKIAAQRRGRRWASPPSQGRGRKADPWRESLGTRKCPPRPLERTGDADVWSRLVLGAATSGNSEDAP